MRRLAPTLGTAVAVALIGLYPVLSGSAYDQQIVGYAFVLAIAALGLNLALGETGLLSLGHAAFVGLGAYGYAVMAAHIPTLLALVGAIAIGAAFAALLGIVTLRLRHVYFSIGTLAAAEVVRTVITQWKDLTGGPVGISVPALNVFGSSLGGADGSYGLIVVALLVAVLVHGWIDGSVLGRRMRAVRDDDIAAASTGISPSRISVIAFCVSGAFAATAGALLGISTSYLTPERFDVDLSILLLAMVVAGGMGSLPGAVIGALVIGLAPELLRSLDDWWPVVYGAVIVLAVLLGRKGIFGALQVVGHSVASRWLRPPARRAAAVPDAAGAASAIEVKTPRPVAVEGLSNHFGGLKALTDVTCTFAPGRITAVIGPNGAGKTTLLNVVTGLLSADAGTVRIGDQQLDGRAPDRIARLGVARTFQTSRLFLSASVFENTILSVEVGGERGASARDRTRRLLEAVGMTDLQQPAEGLSHGHRRTVEVARALGLGPSAVLLDEPAAGLSATEVAELGRLLRAIAAEGAAVVLVEHNMPFVLSYADDAVVLDFGQVLATGSPREVLADPRVVRAYMGEDDLAEAQA
jgi:branched-chain amino acid transport system ATP-binding protein